MSDLGSPHPPHSGIVAITIVLGIFITAFAAWWMLTADADELDVAPAAVTVPADTGTPAGRRR